MVLRTQGRPPGHRSCGSWKPGQALALMGARPEGACSRVSLHGRTQKPKAPPTWPGAQVQVTAPAATVQFEGDLAMDSWEVAANLSRPSHRRPSSFTCDSIRLTSPNTGLLRKNAAGILVSGFPPKSTLGRDEKKGRRRKNEMMIEGERERRKNTVVRSYAPPPRTFIRFRFRAKRWGERIAILLRVRTKI